MKTHAVWAVCAVLAGLLLAGAGLLLVRLRPYWIAKYQGRGAERRGATLRMAPLAGADLRQANRCGAQLTGADLRRADLTGARGDAPALARWFRSGAARGGPECTFRPGEMRLCTHETHRGVSVRVSFWRIYCMVGSQQRGALHIGEDRPGRKMADGKAMWISFRMTEEDAFQYMRAHGSYFWNTAIWVVLAYGFVAAGILGALDGVAALFWLLSSGVLAVAAGAGWYRVNLRRRARRWYRKTPGVTGECLLEITPDGLFGSAALGESTIKWPAFTQVRGTAEYIYLCRGPQRATIIPRRAFASPEEAEAFLQAAREWHAAATGKPVR